VIWASACPECQGILSLEETRKKKGDGGVQRGREVSKRGVG